MSIQGFVSSLFDSTSIYFKEEELSELKKEVEKLDVIDENLSKWIKNRGLAIKRRETREKQIQPIHNSFAISEISVQMAIYCNRLVKKEIFHIDQNNLSKLSLSNSDACNGIKLAFKNSNIPTEEREQLAKRLGVKPHSLYNIPSKKAITVKQADVINDFFKGKGFDIIFNKKSILESEKKKYNDIFTRANTGTKRRIEEAEVHTANKPIYKKAKTDTPSPSKAETNSSHVEEISFEHNNLQNSIWDFTDQAQYNIPFSKEANKHTLSHNKTTANSSNSEEISFEYGNLQNPADAFNFAWDFMDQEEYNIPIPKEAITQSPDSKAATNNSHSVAPQRTHVEKTSSMDGNLQNSGIIFDFAWDLNLQEFVNQE